MNGVRNMDEKTLPIGTIVYAGSKQALIVGYTFADPDDNLTKYYIVVPYPAGYRNSNSFKMIRAEDVRVCSLGYVTAESKIISYYLDRVGDIVSTASKEEYLAAISKLESEGDKA